MLNFDPTFKPRHERCLDLSKQVSIYRNLNRGGYSVMQKGLVVGYVECAYLTNAHFAVNHSGYLRVLREKKKAVHAYARGILMFENPSDMTGWSKAVYNPYVSHKLKKKSGADVGEFNEILLTPQGMQIRKGK